MVSYHKFLIIGFSLLNIAIICLKKLGEVFMLSEEKLNEIKAITKADTPGPWIYDATRDVEDYCIIN